MPHVGSGRGEDLASSDEIKVFKDEGEDHEDEKRSSDLTDVKSSLVTEGDPEKSSQIPGHSYSSAKNVHIPRPDSSPHSGKAFEPLPHSIGYVVSPYHHHPNGTLGAVSMSGEARKSISNDANWLQELLLTRDAMLSKANKVSMVPPPHPGSPLPFMMYNSEAFAQPPPAHMGIPPVHIDPKTGIPVMAAHATIPHMAWKEVLEQQGIPRPPMYPLAPPGQYPHHLFSPDFTSQIQWHTSTMYPMPTGFRGSYATTLPVSTASLPRFSPPTLLPHHSSIPHHPTFHHALVSPGPKQEISHLHENNRHLPGYQIDQKPLLKMTDPGGGNASNGTSSHIHHHHHHTHHNHSQEKKLMKANHIKKPLNAFMLYMKEMRAKVVAECTLKESAAINQILGRRWHSLTREEQAKYYEMARRERQLHLQMYPGWSARDNYAQSCKKKKRKKDKTHEGEGNNPKKCRARFGLDQQSSWCKPCRRKKKCIRYLDGADPTESEDNLGSVESIEAPTPDSRSMEDSDDPDNLTNSSELSLSSPPVPSDTDQKPVIDKGSVCGPLHNNHPLSVHHLSQSHSGIPHKTCDLDTVIPQLPTPPSTDSSTATAPLLTAT